MYVLNKHTYAADDTNSSMVTVMIPARNEAGTISACLDSLVEQTYRHYEILVIDDHSTDGTWQIVKSYAQRYNRIRVYQSKELPGGWKGKTYALHQLTAYAKGEFYLFTDADTVHSNKSIAFGVTNLKKNGLDMISGYPLQKSSCLSIQFIVSLMHFITAFLFPLSLQYSSKHPLFALAVGQYICVSKKAYTAVGGHEHIKGAVTDDIHLARTLVQHGFTQGFLDIRFIVSCRMYTDPSLAFTGITRSIIDFFNRKTVILLLSVLLFTLFIIFPTFLFFLFLTAGSVPLSLSIGYISLSLGWALTSFFHRYSPFIALLSPVILVLPVIMIIYGLLTIVFGKDLIWKDRPVL